MWGCKPWRTPEGPARPHSAANVYFGVAEQLRIRFRDGEFQLLLYVLLGGGRCMRVTVEFCTFVALPFYARRWYDTQGTEVARGEIMHRSGIGPVGAER